MKFLIIIIISLFSLNVNAKTTSEEVKFKRCVDGDTAVFIIKNEEVKIRFLAVDTPETVHPTKDVQKYGKDASEYTCNKLTNAQSIIVEYESGNKTDKYGRTLAWIWADGVLLQSELIKIGYAEVAYIYGKYTYTESLCIDENEAKKEKIGLWQDEKHEQKYCATIEVNEDNYNIDYGKISSYDIDGEGSMINQIAEGAEEVSERMGKNDEETKEIIFYAIIFAAIISIIKKRKN